MKKLITYFLILDFVAFSGCATIFSGSNETINFNSEPQGARVIINGSEEGKTPLAARLRKGKDYIIEYIKDGYDIKSMRMTYSVGAGWIVLDILAGCVGLIVDAVTGNWNSFDQKEYKATLTPKAENR